MSKLTQLSIFAQNRPGKIERVAGVLAEAGINILAITITGNEGFGIIKLITDDTGKADRVLKQHGFSVSRNEVLAIEMVDRPGGLLRVVQALSRNNINIENAHVFVPAKRENAYLVVEVTDPGQTRKILAGEELSFW